VGKVWKEKKRVFLGKNAFFTSPLKEKDNACVHVIVFFFWLTDSPKIGFFCRLERRRSGGAGGFFFS
jgi:hypothetical protein